MKVLRGSECRVELRADTSVLRGKRVGLLFSAKKKSKDAWVRRLYDLLQQSGASVSWVQQQQQQQQQPLFHAVLGKAVHVECPELPGSPLMIDEPSSQASLACSRAASYDALRGLALPPGARLPPFCDSERGSPSFPLILKPLAGVGPESHAMQVHTRPPEGALPQGLAMPFYDHGGCVFKASVAGSVLHVARSPSVPDLPQGDAVPRVLYFRTGHSSYSDAEGRPLDVASPSSPPVQDPSDALLLQIARLIQEHTHLTMFGFDLIWHRASSTWLIIDLNICPSYKRLPGAELAFLHLLCEKLK